MRQVQKTGTADQWEVSVLLLRCEQCKDECSVRRKDTGHCFWCWSGKDRV